VYLTFALATHEPDFGAIPVWFLVGDAHMGDGSGTTSLCRLGLTLLRSAGLEWRYLALRPFKG
jgi:hypothetical protein